MAQKSLTRCLTQTTEHKVFDFVPKVVYPVKRFPLFSSAQTPSKVQVFLAEKVPPPRIEPVRSASGWDATFGSLFHFLLERREVPEYIEYCEDRSLQELSGGHHQGQGNHAGSREKRDFRSQTCLLHLFSRPSPPREPTLKRARKGGGPGGR